MTYVPSLKAISNNEVSGTGLFISNILNVSGNFFASSSTSTFSGNTGMEIYGPLTASGGYSSSYVSTALYTVTVDNTASFNVLTASSVDMNRYYDSTNRIFAVSGAIKIGNSTLTSSNASTTNNSATALYSYPTNNDTTYLVESEVIAKSENKIRITGSTTVAGSEFGAAIVAKDNEIFIGARKAPDTSQRRGRVYVYSTDSDGNLKNEVAVLSSSGNPSAQWFGDKLLIHNNQLIVGAPNNSTDASSVTGSVYVFESGTNGWTQVQKLTPADGVAKNEFGGALHGSGNYLFIGSPQNKISSGVTGSVYVFVTGTGGWTEVQKLSSSFGTTSSFAQSITTVGQDLLIGIGSISVTQGTGSLVLFQSGANGWQQKEKISFAENVYDIEQLLTLEDKKTVIMSDVATGTNIGKVFIISSGSSGYSTVQTITASDQQINARFGASLQASGTTLYIANESFGSAGHGIYVFNSGTNGWTQTTKITPSSVTNIKDSAAGARDAYGTSLCLHKNTIYDGGPQDDQYLLNMGAAIYFLSGSSGWQQQGIPLSSVNSIRGIYKNIGGTLYLTGTSTIYSSSDFSGDPLISASFGLSSSNIILYVTGSNAINLNWNHLTKIYEV